MSIMICFVLLYGNIFEHREKTRRNRIFTFAILASMLALVADVISWIFDGNENYEILLNVSTIISLIMTFIINGLFIQFINEHINEKHKISIILFRIYMFITVIVVGLIIGCSGTGLLFTFENGVYKEGTLYPLYMIFNLLCSFFCLGTNIVNMQYMSMHDRFASMIYIIFPWIVGLVNLFIEEFSYVYPAIVLSLAMLYVMIQSERQNNLQKEGQISYYHARHDALTKIYNRLAYNERIDNLSHSQGSTGIIFTDINGLKYTNDNFGHEEGDNLLTRYVELLCGKFYKEDIFRISGDEFVVILENVSEEILTKRVKTLSKILTEDKVSMASIGFAYGENTNIQKIIKEAESKMYIDKEEFHKAYPEICRK